MIKHFLKLMIIMSPTFWVTIINSQSLFNYTWDKRYGGSEDDAIGWFEKTSDGGFILGGTSFSGISGDKTENNYDVSLQSPDFWMVKTDASGIKIFDKRLGGTNSDQLVKVLQTADNGFLAGGISYSGIGGDKSQSNWDPTQQTNDYWIIKTNTTGIKMWDKRFGGTSFDLFSGVKQTIDGYILCGSSMSGIGGDKTQATQGSWDYWIVKVDFSGTKIWDRRFGGALDDFATCLDVTATGEFIIGGYSKSYISGDKSQPSQGGWDYWVIKIDANGNKIWDKTFGGNYNDWLFDIISTSDNGYLLGGQSFSEASGDKTDPNHDPDPSGSDRWIIKIDSSGNKIWDRTIGADGIEDLSRICETADGGYLISGESYSGINGDKTELNLGTEQTWVVKTDNSGIIQWDKTIFSNGHDEKGTAVMVDSLCLVVVNYTLADTGGYKTALSRGAGDYWITKLCMNDPNFITENNTTKDSWQIYPNPVSDNIYLLNNSFNDIKIKLEIVDIEGRNINSSTIAISNQNRLKLSCGNLKNGLYFCKIYWENQQSILKFVVNN